MLKIMILQKKVVLLPANIRKKTKPKTKNNHCHETYYITINLEYRFCL